MLSPAIIPPHGRDMLLLLVAAYVETAHLPRAERAMAFLRAVTKRMPPIPASMEHVTPLPPVAADLEMARVWRDALPELMRLAMTKR